MSSPAKIKTFPALSSILAIKIVVNVLVKDWHKIMQVIPYFPIGTIVFFLI